MRRKWQKTETGEIRMEVAGEAFVFILTVVFMVQKNKRIDFERPLVNDRANGHPHLCPHNSPH